MSAEQLSSARIRDKSWLVLGTIVRMQIVSSATDDVVDHAFEQAISAIHAVESACSRFDADSELVSLIQSPIGKPVTVSPILFQSIQFAVEVAKWTDGRFDPTVGARMEALGFNRHYLTGETVDIPVETTPVATFRDIELDPFRANNLPAPADETRSRSGCKRIGGRPGRPTFA